LYFDDAAKVVYHLPKEIVDNTIRAFNVSATSANGYGAQGAPAGRYLAPANGPNCIQVVEGDCAPQIFRQYQSDQFHQRHFWPGDVSLS
jgi:hypothetical protein